MAVCTRKRNIPSVPSHERPHTEHQGWIARRRVSSPAPRCRTIQVNGVVSLYSNLRAGTRCLSNIVGSWISKTSLDNELSSKHKETSICILLPFLELIGSLMRFCFFVLKDIHPTQGIMLLWQNCNYWAVRNCLEVAVRGYATKYEYWVY